MPYFFDTAIGGGSTDGPTQYYEIQNRDIRLITSSYTNLNISTLPYKFYGGSAVILNNEIHILGGNNSSCYTKHYKYMEYFMET